MFFPGKEEIVCRKEEYRCCAINAGVETPKCIQADDIRSLIGYCFLKGKGEKENKKIKCSSSDQEEDQLKPIGAAPW